MRQTINAGCNGLPAPLNILVDEINMGYGVLKQEKKYEHSED